MQLSGCGGGPLAVSRISLGCSSLSARVDLDHRGDGWEAGMPRAAEPFPARRPATRDGTAAHRRPRASHRPDRPHVPERHRRARRIPSIKPFRLETRSTGPRPDPHSSEPQAPLPGSSLPPGQGPTGLREPPDPGQNMRRTARTSPVLPDQGASRSTVHQPSNHNRPSRAANSSPRSPPASSRSSANATAADP